MSAHAWVLARVLVLARARVLIWARARALVRLRARALVRLRLRRHPASVAAARVPAAAAAGQRGQVMEACCRYQYQYQ